MKAAVLGATGYTGMVLIRFLANHPQIESILPVSRSQAGNKLTPHDSGLNENMLSKFEDIGQSYISIDTCAALKPDVVFAALPHLASASMCGPFFGSSVVIDLSADLRIKDSALFKKAYGELPPNPEILEQATYGLAEWYSDEIKRADVIANPGCYPTATLLPLLPLLNKGIIEGAINVNALSGVSGAGKKAKTNLLFVERSENMGAYSPGTTHRHLIEIQKECDYTESAHKVLFTPHLVPLRRGMSITTSCKLKKGKGPEDINAAFNTVYSDKPFVLVRPDRLPQTADVWGTNRCDISYHLEDDHVLLFSCIDNLVKGASGQALQNMNIRFGLNETDGLAVHSSM